MEAFLFVIALAFCIAIVPIILWARAKDAATVARIDVANTDHISVTDGTPNSIIQGAKNSFRNTQIKSENENILLKYQALEKLKSLLDSGAISEDEFSIEKRKLIGDPAA